MHERIINRKNSLQPNDTKRKKLCPSTREAEKGFFPFLFAQFVVQQEQNKNRKFHNKLNKQRNVKGHRRSKNIVRSGWKVININY